MDPLLIYKIYDDDDWLKERKEIDFAMIRRLKRERWCWQWNEYRIQYIKLICIMAFIHRRLMFHISGWLARAGYKKRTGK
jgi:hypothetical protein